MLNHNWLQGIAVLVSKLEGEPCVLRINYHVVGEGKAIAIKRVSAVAKLIEARWKTEPGRYKLAIETRVVGVDGVPSK